VSPEIARSRNVEAAFHGNGLSVTYPRNGYLPASYTNELAVSPRAPRRLAGARLLQRAGESGTFATLSRSPARTVPGVCKVEERDDPAKSPEWGRHTGLPVRGLDALG